MTLGIGTPVATVEALWAKHTVHLAEAPGGEPSGVKRFEGPDGTAEAPLTMCAVGDSMVAGCGTDDQSEGLIPDIASALADRLHRDIAWQAHGKLGATMRRVRYRLLPEICNEKAKFDILVICAGSNDIMANRTLDEWRADLGAVLDEAKPLGRHVFVLSPGQMQHEPSLGHALRHVLEREMDEQAAVSEEVCAQHGVVYINMIHEDVHTDAPDFFSPDHFHPSATGYCYMSAGVADKFCRLIRERTHGE